MARWHLIPFPLALAGAACYTDGTAPEEPGPLDPSPYRMALGPFSGDSVTLVVGTLLQIEVRVETTAGTAVVPDWGPSFRSRNPNTVTVDHLGRVLAVAEGSAQIIIEALVEGREVQDSVTVTAICTTELEFVLNPPQQTLAVSEQFTPMLQLTTCGGHVEVEETFTWTASDPTILNVAPATGETIALRTGTAILRVRSVRYSFLAEIPVTVE